MSINLKRDGERSDVSRMAALAVTNPCRSKEMRKRADTIRVNLVRTTENRKQFIVTKKLLIQEKLKMVGKLCGVFTCPCPTPCPG